MNADETVMLALAPDLVLVLAPPPYTAPRRSTSRGRLTRWGAAGPSFGGPQGQTLAAEERGTELAVSRDMSTVTRPFGGFAEGPRPRVPLDGKLLGFALAAVLAVAGAIAAIYYFSALTVDTTEPQGQQLIQHEMVETVSTAN